MCEAGWINLKKKNIWKYALGDANADALQPNF